MDINWLSLGAALYVALYLVKYRIYRQAMLHFLFILHEVNPAAYKAKFQFDPKNTTFDDARYLKFLMAVMLFFGLPLVLVAERSRVFREIPFDDIFHFVRKRYHPDVKPAGDS